MLIRTAAATERDFEGSRGARREGQAHQISQYLNAIRSVIVADNSGNVNRCAQLICGDFNSEN
jgi:hypothetical protein